jgi:hypothetical protein
MYLLYWNDLQTYHYINLMHVIKNVFVSIIGTLLDMPRKTKNGLKSCRPSIVCVETRASPYFKT